MKEKHIGLGNDNTTPEEWATNVHRDTYNSLINHSGLLEYLSLAKNESKFDAKLQLLKKFSSPIENESVSSLKNDRKRTIPE
ncbi:U2 snRNP complex subunit YSF3 SCDLUD_002858 [Saccharomycodes ludwigii]|uniref:U2 snRNP complex subunit YSF3 n=1 Tax=Saccharomycodes ludwigii TaxID=36035 RepID=UPI001E8B6E81|nr:hypothetical protein SCDLUD_002858 [Saccharomycodes ludwigii]KAH3901366.1 hypothetical protein SCDLUD_002858 [Saccharomycodes ludwigii]